MANEVAVQDPYLSDWDIVSVYKLTEEQFTALGYRANGVSKKRVSTITGIPVHTLAKWENDDTVYMDALSKLIRNREGFMRSEVTALRMKSMEVLAWFLLADPEQLLEDNNGDLIYDDEGSVIYKWSADMRKVILQEKRRVAQLLVGDMMERTKVHNVKVTHAVDGNVDKATMDNMDNILADPEKLPSIPHISEVAEGEFEVDESED